MAEFYKNSMRKRRTTNQFRNTSIIFQCFCEKKYTSYPALYLHAENKHSLRIKNKHLSLKKKNQQESHSIMELNQKQFFKTFQNSYDLQIQEYQVRKIYLIPSQRRTIRLTRRTKGKLCVKSIVETFIHEDHHFQSYSTKQDVIIVLQLLQECLNASYKIFDPRNLGTLEQYCLEVDAKMIGNFLNHFSTSYIPQFICLNDSILSSESLIRKPQLNDFLIYFCNWLYQHDYSQLKIYSDKQENQLIEIEKYAE